MAEDFEIKEVNLTFDFKGFLFKLLSHWPLFFICIGIGFAVAYYVNVRKLPIYQMENLISLKDDQNPFFTSNTSLTFNWGVLVGYSAVMEEISLTAILLYMAGVSWTLFYDTIYALQDLNDDIAVGVKSTARLFIKNIKFWLTTFFLIFWTLVVVVIFISTMENSLVGIGTTVLGILLLFMHLLYQVIKLEVSSQKSCLATFKSNRNAGLILVTILFVICFI